MGILSVSPCLCHPGLVAWVPAVPAFVQPRSLSDVAIARHVVHEETQLLSALEQQILGDSRGPSFRAYGRLLAGFVSSRTCAVARPDRQSDAVEASV